MAVPVRDGLDRALQGIAPNIPVSPSTPPRETQVTKPASSSRKPIAHSAPSSPNTPSPFRSASPGSWAHHHDTGSPSRGHTQYDENRSPSRSTRQRERSAPIKTLFKQTSRRLLAKKQSVGQWRLPPGEGDKMGGGDSRSSISSISSFKDLLGSGLGKLRAKSKDRTDGSDKSREGRSTTTLEMASPATPAVVADGQFDDAASVPSPDRGASITSSPPANDEVVNEEISQSAPLPRPAVSTSSRPVSFNNAPRVPFGYPLKPQPTNSPFYESFSSTAPPPAAIVEAQRRHLALARKAGFIPASLAHLRNEPSARAAREFSGMSTNMVIPALDEWPVHEGQPVRSGSGEELERSGGLMQRIRVAMEDQHTPVSSSLNTSQTSSASSGDSSTSDRQIPAGTGTAGRLIDRAGEGDDDRDREIFSPNIPQEPICRHIDGTLSKGFAKKQMRVLAPIGQQDAEIGRAGLSTLTDGEGKDAHKSGEGHITEAEQTRDHTYPTAPASSTSTANSSSTDLPSTEGPTHLRRAMSTKERGHKVYMLPPTAVAAPLSYQLSKAKYTSAHFKIQPMPIPVPPSLLARSRSDASRPHDKMKAADITGTSDGTRGTKQVQSAPGSTFVRASSDGPAWADGCENAPLPDLSPEEVDAFIRAEIRSRTRFVKTPGLEGYSSSKSSSQSSSAAVSRSSSRSSKSSGRGV